MQTRLYQSLSALMIAAVVSGCTGIDGTSSRDILIPNETINISKSLSIPVESLAAGAALYFIIDPLAPNWSIEQSRLDADHYRISMRKKRFTTGGDGEAAQVFYRRADQIVRESHAVRYSVLEFSEGVESTVPVAQRVAQGVVQIIR